MKRKIFEMTGELEDHRPGALTRRTFVGLAAAGIAGWKISGRLEGGDGPRLSPHQVPVTTDIRTNIDEALKIPRTAVSMPGKFPGRVVRVDSGRAASAGKIDQGLARQALEAGLKQLTGRPTAKEAWLEFVSPSDIVGIKVNPVAERMPTSHELTQAVVAGLVDAGVPRANIVIWDRRQEDLHDAGFKPDRFPGVEIKGTEVKGPNGDFYDEKGNLWSLANIDRDALSYYAEIEGSYSPENLPYMVNGGKHSYFSKLVTRRFTKIINLPVLKNMQPVGITFALKNLSYGALTNTNRLHRVGVNAVAEPCAFPCLRDKAVLHIGDALRACYRGMDPRYAWDANRLFIGTDPVAVDTIALEYMTGVRIERGVQSAPDPTNRVCLDIAAKLGLGVSDRAKIDLRDITVPRS